MFDMIIAEERVIAAGHWAFPGFGRLHRLDGKRVFSAL